MTVRSHISVSKVDVSNAAAVTVSAKTYNWVARLASSIAVYINVGAVATTSTTYIPAGHVEYVALNAGQTLSILGVSTSTVSVTEVRKVE